MEYNLDNLYREFKKYLIAGNRLSPNSIKNYLSDIKHFFGWYILRIRSKYNQTFDSKFGLIDLVSGISFDDCYQYRQYLILNHIPLKTCNRRLSSLRIFFTFAIDQGWRDDNPAKKVSNHKIEPGVYPEGVNTPGVVSKTTPENPGGGIMGPDTDLLSSFEANLINKGLSRAQIKEITADINSFLSIK